LTLSPSNLRKMVMVSLPEALEALYTPGTSMNPRYRGLSHLS
jgi:hypothetical protein